MRPSPQEMRRDARVFVMGEDGKSWAASMAAPEISIRNSVRTYPQHPISESAIIGSALGAACTGMRPIAELMYWDFVMEEGTITKWLAKEGEQTTEGAPLEMETDKLTITMDSTATGTVLKILHPEGDTVPITQPIAIVGQPR